MQINTRATKIALYLLTGLLPTLGFAHKIEEGSINHCGRVLCVRVDAPNVFFSDLDRDLVVFNEAKIQVELTENKKKSQAQNDSAWPRQFRAKEGHLDWSLGLLTLRSVSPDGYDVIFQLNTGQVREYR